MQERAATMFLAVAFGAALAGCGGGGGNPGQCFGSAANCIANGNPNVTDDTGGGSVAPGAPTPATPVPGTDGLPVPGAPATGTPTNPTTETPTTPPGAPISANR